MRKLPSFKIVAVFVFGLWLTEIYPLWFTPNSFLRTILGDIPFLSFYIIALIALKYVNAHSSHLDKRILNYFFLGLLIIFANDFINEILTYIGGEVSFATDQPIQAMTELQKTILFAQEIPIYFGHLLLVCFWLQIVKHYLAQRKSNCYKKLIPFFLLILLYCLFMLSLPTLSNHPLDISGYIKSLIFIGIYILTLYALMYNKNKNFTWLASSMVLMIASSLSAFIEYNYHQNGFEAFASFTWILWPGLAFLAFYRMLYYKDYDLKEWFIEPNTLEAKLASRTFFIATSSLVLFFILAYAFQLINGGNFSGLFLFVMLYSLFAVLIAKQIARSFAKPFEHLQHNMDKLLTAQSIPPPFSNFDVAEFNYLQDFIYDRFIDHEKQAEKIKNMGQMAVQVAHDIRSPAAAIMMLAKESVNLPEEQRVSLREAANRVQDIANNLLSDYQDTKANSSGHFVMLYPAIASLLSEKRAQYRHRSVKFKLEADVNTHFAHITVSESELKRMLSNLINNAIEAVSEDKAAQITLTLRIQNQQLILSITDNGQGIAPETLAIIQQGIAKSSKSSGFGLGLKHARELMQEHQAHFNIQSQLNLGTTITLQFKLAPTPCYLAEAICFDPEGEIVILDDDAAIHGAWDKRFEAWRNEYPKLKITHFQDGEACLQYLQSLSVKAKQTLLLLSDYELIHQKLNGLDVIESLTTHGSAILSTSYYDHAEIIKRAILTNAKILPKTLASEVPLLCKKHETKTTPNVDLILLDDQVKLSSIIQFLAKSKNKKINIYHTPYELFTALPAYNKEIAICLDYDLGLPINGLDLAESIYKLEYERIFIASGYRFKAEELPPFVIALPDKMACLQALDVIEK